MNFPPNAMPIAFQLLGLVTSLMAEADKAFDGQPGSGANKKKFVMDAAKGLIETQEMFNKDLMTPEQEVSVLETVDKLTEFVMSAVHTAKLFVPAV